MIFSSITLLIVLVVVIIHGERKRTEREPQPSNI